MQETDFKLCSPVEINAARAVRLSLSIWVVFPSVYNSTKHLFQVRFIASPFAKSGGLFSPAYQAATGGCVNGRV